MRSGFRKTRGISEYVDVVCPLLRLPVDTFDDNLLRTFISKQKPFMQFPGNVIHTLVVPKNPLGDGLSDFSDQAFHIEVFQHTTHNCVCEEICSGQGEHKTRGDSCDCLEEVGCKLGEVNTEGRIKYKYSLTEYPLNAGSQATKNCGTVVSRGSLGRRTLNSPR